MEIDDPRWCVFGSLSLGFKDLPPPPHFTRFLFVLVHRFFHAFSDTDIGATSIAVDHRFAIYKSYNRIAEEVLLPRVESFFILMQLRNRDLDSIVRYRGSLSACLGSVSKCVIACSEDS